ncbi:MAG: DUF2892 domain-containing protein [Candidatus Omnitrophota bacterium]|jgi:hypothetical protein
MAKNIGKKDRLIRLILGLGLIPLALLWRCWLTGIVGLFLIFTAAIGFCGIYQLLGISTCKIKE